LPLKIDGWKTIQSCWGGLPGRCELLFLGSVFETTPVQTANTRKKKNAISEAVAVIKIAGKALVITFYSRLFQRSQGKTHAQRHIFGLSQDASHK